MTGVALYHEMRPDDTFEHTADILWHLVRKSCIEYPHRLTMLYLDIDGHRTSVGGFDADAFEIHRFVIKMLMPYLYEANTPLAGPMRNYNSRTDMPQKLQLRRAPQHRKARTG